MPASAEPSCLALKLLLAILKMARSRRFLFWSKVTLQSGEGGRGHDGGVAALGVHEIEK